MSRRRQGRREGSLRRRLGKPRDQASRVLGGVNKFILGAGALAGAVLAILAVRAYFFPPSKTCTGGTAEFKGEPKMMKISPLYGTVSYKVKTNGDTNEKLTVRWTLFKAGRDGSFRPVDGFVDRSAAKLTPKACPHDQVAEDLPVAVEKPGQYRIVLTLLAQGQVGAYSDRTQTDFAL